MISISLNLRTGTSKFNNKIRVRQIQLCVNSQIYASARARKDLGTEQTTVLAFSLCYGLLMSVPKYYQVRIKEHLLSTMLETVAEILQVLHTSAINTINLQEQGGKQLRRKKIGRT